MTALEEMYYSFSATEEILTTVMDISAAAVGGGTLVDTEVLIGKSPPVTRSPTLLLILCTRFCAGSRCRIACISLSRRW